METTSSVKEQKKQNKKYLAEKYGNSRNALAKFKYFSIKEKHNAIFSKEEQEEYDYLYMAIENADKIKNIFLLFENTLVIKKKAKRGYSNTNFSEVFGKYFVLNPQGVLLRSRIGDVVRKENVNCLKFYKWLLAKMNVIIFNKNTGVFIKGLSINDNLISDHIIPEKEATVINDKLQKFIDEYPWLINDNGNKYDFTTNVYKNYEYFCMVNEMHCLNNVHFGIAIKSLTKKRKKNDEYIYELITSDSE